MKTVFSYSVVAAITITAAFSQSNLGSIQGTVVGSDGTPLAGSRIYAAVKAATQKTKAPPTLVSYVVNGTTARSAGKPQLPGVNGPIANPANLFLISKLPAGAYILCVQTIIPGWLDPCHWSPTVPVINLAAGQNLTGQTVVMTKGAVVQVRINDPSKLLAAHPAAIPHDIEVVALGSNNAYYHARIASIDKTGRTEEVTVPFNATHTLTVRSQQFALTDANGAAVPATGHTQPVQLAAGSAALQFTYTVTGKSH